MRPRVGVDREGSPQHIGPGGTNRPPPFNLNPSVLFYSAQQATGQVDSGYRTVAEPLRGNQKLLDLHE